MKTMLSSTIHHYLAIISIFLIASGLIVGTIGCGGGVQYNLNISSTAGGTVTTPGEGTFTYDEGTLVELVAEADEGYLFVNWTGDISTIADVYDAETIITMNGDYSITANFVLATPAIDWYDLYAIRDNLVGAYVLMNDLDSATAGYEELASATANGGKGWEPIGTSDNQFTGIFDGQGFEIRDLCINRPDESYAGLFGYVGGGGVIRDIGMMNVVVTGYDYVGILVGRNDGTVVGSYSIGSVTGTTYVGGLVGSDSGSTVSNSYYNYDESLINGQNIITLGALADEDFDQWLANNKFLDVNERLSQEDGYYLINDVSDFKQLLVFGQNSTLKFRLTNDLDLGNEPNFYIPYLAGEFDGNGHKISNPNSNLDAVSPLGLFGYLALTGNITKIGVENVNIIGYERVGGLVGLSYGTVSSAYSTGNVTGNYTGGLVGGNHYGTVSNSYSTSSVTGDRSIGGLVGENYYGIVSNSHFIGSLTGGGAIGGLVALNYYGTVSDSYSTGSVNGTSEIGGLVGHNEEGTVSDSYSTTNVNGYMHIGGLVGLNGGNVSNSYATGTVTGYDCVGGLVGTNVETVSDCHASGEVSGAWYVGGVVGHNFYSTVSRSYFSSASVTGHWGVGGLVGLNQEGTVSDSYSAASVTGDSYSFYVGGLVGSNGWGEHSYGGSTVTRSYSSGTVTSYTSSGTGGLIGGNYGTVTDSHSTCSVSGYTNVGGLMGNSGGNVGNSYCTGSVSGWKYVGGLVGYLGGYGTVSNCYARASATGTSEVGGLVGSNGHSTVTNCYAAGLVTGTTYAGGLVGRDLCGSPVNDSFWDVEASGQSESAGGTGKNTTEMQDITTFSGATWDIIAVANPSTRNPAYVWNIFNDETYPFLSWES